MEKRNEFLNANEDVVSKVLENLDSCRITKCLK